MTWRALAAAVLLMLATPGETSSPSSPSSPSSSPSTVSLGARVGLNGAFVLLPMAGVSAGLTSRFRFTDTFSLEPHVDGAMDQFFAIGFIQGQLGLPVVASGTSGGVRHHVGLGPLVGLGSFAGHVNGAESLTLLGGELLAGMDWAIAPSWDTRFQARLWVTSPVAQAMPLVGVMATFGVMYDL